MVRSLIFKPGFDFSHYGELYKLARSSVARVCGAPCDVGPERDVHIVPEGCEGSLRKPAAWIRSDMTVFYCRKRILRNCI